LRIEVSTSTNLSLPSGIPHRANRAERSAS
jgi:hypothetical protein